MENKQLDDLIDTVMGALDTTGITTITIALHELSRIQVMEYAKKLTDVLGIEGKAGYGDSSMWVEFIVDPIRIDLFLK